jgi:hypothetical protein
MRQSAFARVLQLALGVAGFAALLFALVAASYHYNVRVDLSPGSRFTLSDHGLAVLRNLEDPVHVTGFIRTEDPRNVVLKDLLWQAGRESSQISYDVVDVNRNPAMAAEYGISAYGAAVVESAGKRSDFTNPSETQLVSAILDVTQDPRKVYLLGGHGECSIKETERHVGCSVFGAAIRNENYGLEELTLFGDRLVPEDADILIIAGPTSDPLQSEIDAIASYLDGGGKLLALVDPFVAPRLVELLERYGIRFGGDVVLDPENRLGGGELLSAVITDLSSQHLITSTLDSPALLSGIRSVEARSDDSVGRSATRLLRTSERSWATEDSEVMRGAEPRFVAGRDRNGPITVGVEVAQPAARGEAGRKTVILAYGDSQFVTNRFLDYLGNKDLLLNSLNWLARDDNLVSVRSKAKTPGKNFFFVSQAEMSDLFQRAVIVQPGLLILFGALLFVYRRLRP